MSEKRTEEKTKGEKRKKGTLGQKGHAEEEEKKRSDWKLTSMVSLVVLSLRHPLLT